MKCPFCNHELDINDFFKVKKNKSLVLGSHTTKEFKGKQIYGIENTDNMSNLRTLHRFWVCPYCDKLIQITETH
ncbi:MAG: hypothetical protein GF364_07470 [Candidatus Lokiarchaeota archaeon]|nr:hypothetical protein [Candidatus Lokiarchaeota archaeon]